MFFKNLTVYRVHPEFKLPSPKKLQELLSEFEFTPCGPTDKQKYGWTSPLSNGIFQLFLGEKDFVVFKARLQKRPIPAETIRTEVELKVKAVEAVEGRYLRTPEKAAIKDEVIMDLLPRAFTRDSYHYLVYIPSLNVLVSDQSSTSNAEASLSLLRKTLGSLPCVPVTFKQHPSSVMTEWLKDNSKLPEKIKPLSSVKVCHDIDTDSALSTKNLDLDSASVKEALKADFKVDQLALEFSDVFSFVAKENGNLVKIRWADQIADRNEDYDPNDRLGRLEADLTTVCLELKHFYPKWVEMFNGYYDYE